MNPRTALSVLAFCLVAAAPQAVAQVYKWTDKDGRVHYGSTPPAGARVIERPSSARPAPAPSSASPAPASDEEAVPAPPRPGSIEYWRLRDQELRQRLNEREAQASANARQSAEREQKRQAACASLADDLDRGGRTRWYRLNDKGEREYFTDAEIDRYVQEMEQTYARHCRR